MSLLNHIAEFCKVLGSSIGRTNRATLYDVTAGGGIREDASGNILGEDESDEGGEHSHEQETFGAIGLICRPLDPSSDGFAEALCLRTDDGLSPFAYRDLRINRAVNASGSGAPAKGQIMLGGYGGAFLALSAQAAGSRYRDIVTLYVPVEFDGAGVPTKAHAIQIDPRPGFSSISLVHADGPRFVLTEDAGSGPGIVASVDGETFIRLAAGELTLQAEKVLLKGNVFLGRNAEAGLPLLAGVASPPSGSVYVSST